MSEQELFEILEWADKIAEDMEWPTASDMDPEERYRWEHCTEL